MNSSWESSNGPSVLLFEPRIEGHHASWLHYLAEDLKSGGYRITMACDWRPPAQKLLLREFGNNVEGLTISPIYGENGNVRGGGMMAALRILSAEANADFVFLCNFNEIASTVFRRAAVGLLPPNELRGCLGGVYHRPTMLLKNRTSVNDWLKRRGFRRLTRDGWFSPLFFTDESLLRKLHLEFPGAELRYLVTPGAGRFGIPTTVARQKLAVPHDRNIFLFYGGPYRRKGLHLALEAFENLPTDYPAFLICAGDQSKEPELLNRLRRLETAGRALVIGRYISSEDELTSLCFCAADAILLPYIDFLTASGVMAQACAAGKPVLASDLGWLGNRVRTFQLGLLFPQDDAGALLESIKSFIERLPAEGARWRENALGYTKGNNREVFREQLLAGFSATQKFHRI